MITRKQCLFFIRQHRSAFVQLFDWLVEQLREPAVGEDSARIADTIRRVIERHDVHARLQGLERRLDAERCACTNREELTRNLWRAWYNRDGSFDKWCDDCGGKEDWIRVADYVLSLCPQPVERRIRGCKLAGERDTAIARAADGQEACPSCAAMAEELRQARQTAGGCVARFAQLEQERATTTPAHDREASNPEPPKERKSEPNAGGPPPPPPDRPARRTREPGED